MQIKQSSALEVFKCLYHKNITFYAYRKNFLFKKSNNSKYSTRCVEQVTLYLHFPLILTDLGIAGYFSQPKRMNENLIFYHVNSKLMVMNKV